MSSPGRKRQHPAGNFTFTRPFSWAPHVWRRERVPLMSGEKGKKKETPPLGGYTPSNQRIKYPPELVDVFLSPQGRGMGKKGAQSGLTASIVEFFDHLPHVVRRNVLEHFNGLSSPNWAFVLGSGPPKIWLKATFQAARRRSLSPCKTQQLPHLAEIATFGGYYGHTRRNHKEHTHIHFSPWQVQVAKISLEPLSCLVRLGPVHKHPRLEVAADQVLRLLADGFPLDLHAQLTILPVLNLPNDIRGHLVPRGVDEGALPPAKTVKPKKTRKGGICTSQLHA